MSAVALMQVVSGRELAVEDSSTFIATDSNYFVDEWQTNRVARLLGA